MKARTVGNLARACMMLLLLLLIACISSGGTSSKARADSERSVQSQHRHIVATIHPSGVDAKIAAVRSGVSAQPRSRHTSKRGTRGPTETTAPQRTVTTVRGGFVNELACPIGRFRPTSDPTMFALDCRGPGSIWTGGLTGHTVVHLIGTIDVYGNMVGNYEEWFYGRYAGDSTQGGLHFKGTFFIDGETMEFFADGKIVDGTCGFAGSTGTFTGEGNSVFGGYTAKWSRPASLVAAEPTCNPVYRDSLPV